MKIKWLVILSAIFVGVIIISLLITQQNNNTVPLPREETPAIAQSTNYLQPLPSPIAKTSVPLPLLKSGITAIQASSKEPENKVPPVQAERSIETTTNTLSEDNAPNTAAQENTQAGITIIGKHPSPKEPKEMNSAGIVMY